MFKEKQCGVHPISAALIPIKSSTNMHPRYTKLRKLNNLTPSQLLSFIDEMQKHPQL